MINFSEYSLPELVQMRNDVESYIRSVEDGFFYLCLVRSYGRVYREKSIKNVYSLQEFCDFYDGEHGIADVYSNNPDLKIANYGDVCFVKSENDFNLWKEYQTLKNTIKSMEKELLDWSNRDEVPFHQRASYIAPWFTEKDINELKVELENYDMSFVPPKKYCTLEQS